MFHVLLSVLVEVVLLTCRFGDDGWSDAFLKKESAKTSGLSSSGVFTCLKRLHKSSTLGIELYTSRPTMDPSSPPGHRTTGFAAAMKQACGRCFGDSEGSLVVSSLHMILYKRSTDLIYIYRWCTDLIYKYQCGTTYICLAYVRVYTVSVRATGDAVHCMHKHLLRLLAGQAASAEK